MADFQLIKDDDGIINKITTILDLQTNRILQLESDINRLRDELYGLKDRLYDEQIL